MNKQEFINELNSYPVEFINHHEGYCGEENWYAITLASFGDYDGSTEIERANHRWLKKHFSDFVSSISGAHYSESSVIHMETVETLQWSSEGVQQRAGYLIEIINSLCDYPVIDDMLASEIKLEMQEEAWENFYKREIIGALDKKFPELDIEYHEIDEDQLLCLLDEKLQEQNIYWEIYSGGNVYLDYKKAIDEFTQEELAAIISE